MDVPAEEMPVVVAPDFAFCVAAVPQVLPGVAICLVFSVVNWPSASSGNALTMSDWLGTSWALTTAGARGADTSSSAVVRPAARDSEVRFMGSPWIGGDA